MLLFFALIDALPSVSPSYFDDPTEMRNGRQYNVLNLYVFGVVVVANGARIFSWSFDLDDAHF